jgi:hypothetical protein
MTMISRRELLGSALGAMTLPVLDRILPEQTFHIPQYYEIWTDYYDDEDDLAAIQAFKSLMMNDEIDLSISR